VSYRDEGRLRGQMRQEGQGDITVLNRASCRTGVEAALVARKLPATPIRIHPRVPLNTAPPHACLAPPLTPQQAYQVGYSAAITDVLSTVQSSIGAGQDASQTLSRLMDWADARQVSGEYGVARKGRAETCLTAGRHVYGVGKGGRWRRPSAVTVAGRRGERGRGERASERGT
jgi:hypothetical protein